MPRRSEPRGGPRPGRLWLGLLLALLAGCGLLALRLRPELVLSAASWALRTEHALGPSGWLLAAAIQVVIALCGILPASVGAVACGLAYGIVGGFLLSTVGTLVGAILAFWLARSLFRPMVMRVLSRRARFAWLDQAVARDGWRLVCLLRVSPLMPFAVTSYALGLTGLGFRGYLLGTLAALPALLGYVVLGHLSRDGFAVLVDRHAGAMPWLLHGLLLVLAIGATALLTLRLGGLVVRALRLPEQA